MVDFRGPVVNIFTCPAPEDFGQSFLRFLEDHMDAQSFAWGFGGPAIRREMTFKHLPQADSDDYFDLHSFRKRSTASLPRSYHTLSSRCSTSLRSPRGDPMDANFRDTLQRPHSVNLDKTNLLQIDPRRKYKRRKTDSLSEIKDSGSDNDSGSLMSDSEEHELGPLGSDIDADEETGLTGNERQKYLQRKRRRDALDSRIAGGGGISKEEAREADRNVIRKIVFNAILIGLWYLFSLSISIYNKWMFSGDHLDFHFPLFTTSLHMVVQFLLASTVLLIFPSLRPRSPPPTALNPVPKPLVTRLFYFTRLVPTGTTTSLDIGLGNTSLRFITLTFYTMCKSSVLIFVLTFAFLFRLEQPSFKLIAIILTMTVGVLLMVYGETAFHALGFALAMSASFFSGFRWALTQILLLRHPATSNPFATLFFLSPIMFVTLFTIAMFAEQPAPIITGLHLLVANQGTTLALLLLLFPGTLAFCMIAAEFTLLQRTSVVTLSICGIFKEVVTISAAGIVFHDELSVVNVSGLLVTIVCIACYNYLKLTKMREEARRKVGMKGGNEDRRLFPRQVQEDEGDDEERGRGVGGEEDSRPLMNGDVEGTNRTRDGGDEAEEDLDRSFGDGVGTGLATGTAAAGSSQR